MSWDFKSTMAGYRNLWRASTIRAEDYAETTAAANKIIANEFRYKQVQAAAGGGVPWYWIGAIHYRESSNSFSAHMHNGDPLTGYTTHVPEGRPQIGHPPPFTWEESCADWIRLKNLDDVTSWPVERQLFQAENNNGLGYALYKGINSPYVWAATSLQQRGKYTSDGNYDPTAWDTQLGVAAILKRLAEMRPDIAADLATTSQPDPTPMPDPTPAPVPADVLKKLEQLLALIQELMPILSLLSQLISGRPISMAGTAATKPAPTSNMSTNLMGGGLLSIASVVASLLGYGPGLETTAGQVLPLLGFGAGLAGFPAPVVTLFQTLLGKGLDRLRQQPK